MKILSSAFVSAGALIAFSAVGANAQTIRVHDTTLHQQQPYGSTWYSIDSTSASQNPNYQTVTVKFTAYKSDFYANRTNNAIIKLVLLDTLSGTQSTISTTYLTTTSTTYTINVPTWSDTHHRIIESWTSDQTYDANKPGYDETLFQTDFQVLW